MYRVGAEVNRAFSAGRLAGFDQSWALPQARDDCCAVSATNLGAVAEALCLQRYRDFYSLFGRFDQLRARASADWQTRQFASICCAKGAISFPAWGIAPGIQSSMRQSAESAIQCSIRDITLVEMDAVPHDSRPKVAYTAAPRPACGERTACRAVVFDEGGR